ncbi:MAG: hypothetical protein JWR38_4376 [Mucilaginibacter sp.]|nr:hypothetical protein [Mucilaginibacter sp.]
MHYCINLQILFELYKTLTDIFVEVFRMGLRIFVTCLCVSVLNICLAQHQPSALDKLDQTLKNKIQFTQAKEAKLAFLKRPETDNNNQLKRYLQNRTLYKEYLKFKIDSALSYAARNLRIAKLLKSHDLEIETRLDIANLYFPLNKFLEANDILKSINSKSLSKAQLKEYYLSEIEFYEHYLTNNDNKGFKIKTDQYRDSLLHIVDRQTMTYHINWSLKNIRSGNLKYAEKYLLKVLKDKPENTADYAMISYLLGLDYEMQQIKSEAIHFYALSAAGDVQLSIKDNAAMQALALLLYATGDIDHAYNCTQSAIEDALFCDTKFRTLHMSNFYAIVNKAYLQKEAKQKDQLKHYLLLISTLSFFLVLAVIYVHKQMKRESRMKSELATTTRQLAELNKMIGESNTRLNQVNVQLLEANKVKETYIANFFDLCSAYINKLENFRKLVNKKASEQPDNLLKMLRSTSIVDNEVEELYKVFDSVFLSLYPNFIDDFNALLIPNEKIEIKHKGILNTELRIYALMRLGITDSAQIAGFLRYSLSTIYNYRTSARNKAAVSRDLFEDRVMKISSIISVL